MERHPGWTSLVAFTLAVVMTPPAFSTPNRAAGLLGLRAEKHLERKRAEMRLPDGSGFEARSVVWDDLGRAHVRVEQKWKGLPVFEGDMVVHLDTRSSDVVGVTEASVQLRPVDVTTKLSRSDAVALAHEAFQPLGAYTREPESSLVLFQTENGATVPAWHVHLEVENDFEVRHQDFMIDARSGALLKAWNTLMEIGAAGTGLSQYSRTVPLFTNSTAEGYELRDMTRGSTGNRTLNMNRRTLGGAIFTDSDNVWGDGENFKTASGTTSANGQTAAVDAHFGLQQTWDYFLFVHERAGIDAMGTATFSRVHFSRNYDNAFWSDSCFCVTYGDGNFFSVLTPLDVAGHEMSHGICSKTANLTYSGESGGLNEASSDIFGTMVEFYTRPETANYLIGEQLYSSPGTALRYMYKPSLDGRSPDCYSESVATLDVHLSSGIANRFFYFLAEGTTELSGPGCDGSTFSGVGRGAAEKIWYRALTVYMTSGTKYTGARTATLEAARDLYSEDSPEYRAVATAWSAVNVSE